MAGLEDIVQRVAIEGTGEIGQTLEELAGVGAAAFEALESAANNANGAFSLMSGGTLAVIGAVIAAGAAIYKLVDSTAQSTIALKSLGDAMGISAGSAEALEHAFGSVGISTEQFARAMERTAQRIGMQWQQIQEEMTTGSTKIEAAQIAVKEAHIATEEAMVSASFASAEWKNKLTDDAMSVVDAYKAVQRSSEDAANTAENDALSVRSAELSLEEARAKADAFRGGYKENVWDVRDRQQKKLDLAAEQAQEKLTEIQEKQQRDQQDASDKRAKQEQKLTEAKLKQSEDQAKAPLEMAKTDLGVEKSKNAETSAIEHMDKEVNTNLVSIVDAIKGGRSKEALEADPQKFLKAAAAIASQEQGGGLPTTTKVLEQLITQLREAKAGGATPAEMLGPLQSMGFRGDQGGRFLTEIFKKNFDMERTIKAGEGGVTDQAVRNSFGLEEQKQGIKAWAEEAKRDLLLDHQMPNAPPAPQSQLHPGQQDGWFTSGQPVKQPDTGAATTGDGLKKADDKAQGLASTFSDLASFISSVIKMAGSKDEGLGHADGGYISGAGSATSDSIGARLSNGEYVVKAAAVRAYGRDFMDSINSIGAQGFAFGGYVGTPAPRFSTESGAARSAGNPVNLHIDGNTFKMNAPADVAAKLTHFAISRQMAETGRKPSWVR